jgi:hypothetical protein
MSNRLQLAVSRRLILWNPRLNMCTLLNILSRMEMFQRSPVPNYTDPLMTLAEPPPTASQPLMFPYRPSRLEDLPTIFPCCMKKSWQGFQICKVLPTTQDHRKLQKTTQDARWASANYTWCKKTVHDFCPKPTRDQSGSGFVANNQLCDWAIRVHFWGILSMLRVYFWEILSPLIWIWINLNLNK